MRKIRIILCLLAAILCLTGLVQASEPVFKQGDKAPEVAEVQLKMKAMGYGVGNTDGFFSWRFAQAVKAFQRSQGLKPDGAINSLTYLRIMKKPFPDRRKTTVSGKPAIPAKQEKEINALLATAKRYIGVPYRFGGTTPGGFDCSGFVQFVFSQHGQKLPRGADSQFSIGRPAQRNLLQSGDLVFFTTYEQGPSHNGIYLGKGQFIHASSSRGIMISNLDEAYWKARYIGARRVF